MRFDRFRNAFGLVALAALTGPSLAQMPAGEMMTGHHQMHIDASGSVMNQNSSELPYDCAELGPDVEIAVYGGRNHSRGVDGQTFGYSEHEYFAEPCSRFTVTFVNDDAIRHQWMIHGLPKYLYPGGMFHLEAAGGATVTGTFIVPS
ncbi:MAG: copper oxidase, partial [Gammaproteobacteria bacterium]